MNRGTSSAQPEGLVESLDIDLDTLDHALMDLLTSDWQTLYESEPQEAAQASPQFSPAA